MLVFFFFLTNLNLAIVWNISILLKVKDNKAIIKSWNMFFSSKGICVCRRCRLSNVHNSSRWLLNSIFLHLSCSPKWGGGAIFSCVTHQLQTRGLFHFSQWEQKTQIQKKADARSCRMRKLISSLEVREALIFCDKSLDCVLTGFWRLFYWDRGGEMKLGWNES